MEEEIIKEIVNDETMHCAACNITLYNESVWEVHKKGKVWIIILQTTEIKKMI